MATTRFADHLLQGDHASRPAAGDVPAGTLYACSDHGLIYQSDGASWSTWATLGGAVAAEDVSYDNGSSGLSATDVQAAVDELDGLILTPVVFQIFDSTLGSAQANFDVTSIPGSYKHLRLVLQGRSTRAAQTEDPIKMLFNNDTGANYDEQYQQNFATSTLAAENIGGSAFGGGTPKPGTLPAASSPAGAAASVIIDVPNYAGTTFRKQYMSMCSGPLDDSGNGQRLWFASGEWRSTAAITRITIAPVNANFDTGSRLTVYAFN